MNRKITALLIGAAAMLSLAACGEKEESSARPINIEKGTAAAVTTQAPTNAAGEAETQPATFHERHDYEDGVLVGRWSGDEADIVLQENGKVSAEFDISEVMMLSKDGSFMLSGETNPPVQYDGSTMTVFANAEDGGEAVEFLKLSRIGDPDPDSFDGLYDIATEEFKQKLAGIIVGDDTADFDVKLRIRYGKFIVCLPEFCDYTQKGDEFSLALEGSGDGSLIDELGDSTFVLDGDNVTFYTDEGISEQFEKKE